jgi:hypothetical protein
MDKYRYHIYPDRIYVFDLGGATVEIKGHELASLLGIDSYYTEA